jgi:hypothetical protein
MISESTGGPMVVYTKETGYVIKCMAEETLVGLMEDSTQVIILMIKNKVTEFSLGPMAVNTMAPG